MWYQIKKYLQFILNSKTEHGIHSPFVYDMVTKCFYAKTDSSIKVKLNAYRKSLLNNSKTIAITDFGSGSKVFVSNNRSIQQIAKTSGTTNKRAKLLYRILLYFEPKHILELGTSFGIGTYSMALAKPDAHIVSIEGCQEISKVANQQLKDFDITNVNLKIGKFSDILPNLNEPHWDFVFFDGHHEKEATIKYFNELLSTAHNDSIFIFDDIHWSKDMTKAWTIIKKHPKVTVTIDTFFWGLVFFRQEQVKENFIIRL